MEVIVHIDNKPKPILYTNVTKVSVSWIGYNVRELEIRQHDHQNIIPFKHIKTWKIVEPLSKEDEAWLTR